MKIKKASKKPVRRITKKVPRKKVVPKKSLRKKIIRKKIIVPQPLQSEVPSDDRLPRHYGEDGLTLLVRDPWWIFSYWEITPATQERAAQKARRAGHRHWKTVLRVYDVTKSGPSKPDSFFDIELNFFTDNWYIDVGMPSRLWMAEVGYRAASGEFFALVRSNVVGTPAFGLSNVFDEEWRLPEDVFLKIIGFTGPGAQSGSMDIRKMLEKYLQRVVSSESSPRTPLTR